MPLAIADTVHWGSINIKFQGVANCVLLPVTKTQTGVIACAYKLPIRKQNNKKTAVQTLRLLKILNRVMMNSLTEMYQVSAMKMRITISPANFTCWNKIIWCCVPKIRCKRHDCAQGIGRKVTFTTIGLVKPLLTKATAAWQKAFPNPTTKHITAYVSLMYIRYLRILPWGGFRAMHATTNTALQKSILRVVLRYRKMPIRQEASGVKNLVHCAFVLRRNLPLAVRAQEILYTVKQHCLGLKQEASRRESAYNNNIRGLSLNDLPVATPITDGIHRPKWSSERPFTEPYIIRVLEHFR